jgi:hypothetical protein
VHLAHAVELGAAGSGASIVLLLHQVTRPVIVTPSPSVVPGKRQNKYTTSDDRGICGKEVKED